MVSITVRVSVMVRVSFRVKFRARVRVRIRVSVMAIVGYGGPQPWHPLAMEGMNFQTDPETSQ